LDVTTNRSVLLSVKIAASYEDFQSHEATKERRAHEE
jgi:hypothetical protein